MNHPDVIVVGGGLVGSAIGYGLLRSGLKALIVDEGDIAYRASRGNFGLVWVQGKGADMPRYALWTRRSADLWPDFAGELRERTGIDLQLAQPGGVHPCLSLEEFEARDALLRRLANALSDFRYEMLDRRALDGMVPGLGPEVVGASYCPHDGHVNPLRLLRALHAAFLGRGGAYEPNRTVRAVRPEGGGFRVETEGGGGYRAARVVLAAGNGTPRLAGMVGLRAPVRPQRGQILVTAKVRPFLPMPLATLRQTGEGGVMIGDSKEEVGFDDRTTPRVMHALADRAVRTFPFLRNVPVVRAWGALRVMSPDGHPVYEQSGRCPGAFVACVHSGVTLAAAHAGPLATAVAEGGLPDFFRPFRAERFDVHQAA